MQEGIEKGDKPSCLIALTLKISGRATPRPSPIDESVSAIVGKNGVGKTNVLKCIDWVASSSISTDPFRVTQAGNASDELDEVSTKLVLELDERFSSTA